MLTEKSRVEDGDGVLRGLSMALEANPLVWGEECSNKSEVEHREEVFPGFCCCYQVGHPRGPDSQKRYDGVSLKRRRISQSIYATDS